MTNLLVVKLFVRGRRSDLRTVVVREGLVVHALSGAVDELSKDAMDWDVELREDLFDLWRSEQRGEQQLSRTELRPALTHHVECAGGHHSPRERCLQRLRLQAGVA